MGPASFPKLGLLLAISLVSTFILGSPLFTTSLGDTKSQIRDVDVLHLYTITFYGAGAEQSFDIFSSGVNYSVIHFKIDVDRIHTSAGPCYFKGTSGLFFDITGEDGGDIKIGPPQMIVSLVCGLTVLTRDIQERETTGLESFDLTTTAHLEQDAGPAVDIQFFGSSGEFVGSNNYTSGEYLENPCVYNDTARCIPFEVSYITTNLGPCNFLGEFGTWYHINSQTGGVVTVGPPQQISWFFCGYEHHLPNEARDAADVVPPGFVEITFTAAIANHPPDIDIYPNDGTTYVNPCFNKAAGSECVRLEISYISASTGPCLFKGESGIWFPIMVGPNTISIGPPQQIVEFYCVHDTYGGVEAFNLTKRDPEEFAMKEPVPPGWVAIFLLGADNSQTPLSGLYPDDGTPWLNPCFFNSKATCISLEISLIVASTGPCLFKGESGIWFEIAAGPNEVVVSPPQQIVEFYCGYDTTTRVEAFNFTTRDLEMTKTATIWFDRTREYKVSLNCDVWNNPAGIPRQISSNAGPCWFQGQTTGDFYTIPDASGGSVDITPAESIYDMCCGPCDATKRKRDDTAVIQMLRVGGPPVEYQLPIDGKITYGSCNPADGCKPYIITQITSTLGPCYFRGHDGHWFVILNDDGTVEVSPAQYISEMSCTAPKSSKRRFYPKLANASVSLGRVHQEPERLSVSMYGVVIPGTPEPVNWVVSNAGPCYFLGAISQKTWAIEPINGGETEISPVEPIRELFCLHPEPTTTRKDLAPTPRQASPTAYITFVHADNTGLAFDLIADGALTAPLCPAGDAGCDSQSVYEIESSYGPCIFQGKTTGTWYNIDHFTTEPTGGTVRIGAPQPIYQMCCNCAVNGAPGHDEVNLAPVHAKKWPLDTTPQVPTVDISLFQYGPPDPISKNFRAISKLFDISVPASMDSGRTLTLPNSFRSSDHAIDYISTTSGPCYFETESGARIDIADDGWNDVHVAPPQVIRYAACGLSENFSTLKRDSLDRSVSVTLYSAATVADSFELKMNEGPVEPASELAIDHIRTNAGPCFIHDMADNVVAEIPSQDGGEVILSPPQMVLAVWCGGS